MKILVTGGCGFIGSNFINAFADDYRIVALDNFFSGKITNITPHPNVSIVEGDITNYSFLETLFQNYSFDGIVHLAAIASVQECQGRPVESSDVNYRASLKLLDLSLKYEIKKFIFASSAAVYGDATDLPKREESSIPSPVSFYGVDKYAVERDLIIYTKISKLQGTAFRFFNVFGPNQDPSSPYSGVLSLFVNNVIQSSTPEIVIYGDGTQTRDFIYVTDLVRGIHQALNDPSMSGQVFNLGTGKETSLLEVVRLLEDISGKKIKVDFRPWRIGDIRRSFCDNSKVCKTGLEMKKKFRDGLEDFYHYLER